MAERWIWCVLAICAGCGDDLPAGTDEATSDTGTATSDTGSSSPSESGASGSSSGEQSSSGEPTGASSTSTSSSSSSSSGDTSGGIDDPPEATDDLFKTPMDVELVVDAAQGLFANDTDDGVLTLAEVDATTERGGTITVADDGSFTYAPPPGDWGPDRFAYTVMDDAGAMSSAVAAINVTPVDIAMSELAASHNGFSIDGGEDDWLSGFSLSRAGDVDGDGLDDVFVGSPIWGDFEGRAHVVFGKDDLDTVDLFAVQAGSGGFVIQGEQYDMAGWSIGGGGDVNGDGLADVVLGGGNPFVEDPVTVEGFVVFGKANTLGVALGQLEIDAAGFVISGQSSSSLGAGGDYPTMVVSVAGDVDDDGLDDLIVGFQEVPDTGSLRAWVVHGKADASPVDLADIGVGTGGFVIEGESVGWGSDFPTWLSGAGDVNGDGLADVLIGAPTIAPARSYVVFGKADTETVDLAELGDGGFVIEGDWVDAVSGAGDVDGDGLDDLVLGAPYEHRGYVVFGKADTETVELSSVSAGMGGFVVTGEENSQAGRVVAGGGDVNGDGLDDVVIATEAAFAPTGAYGRAYVVYGKADGLAVDLYDVVEGDGGFVLDAEPISNSSANAAAIVDVDGDALCEVVVGAYNTPVGGVDFLGRTYVMSGVSTAPY